VYASVRLGSSWCQTVNPTATAGTARFSLPLREVHPHLRAP